MTDRYDVQVEETEAGTFVSIWDKEYSNGSPAAFISADGAVEMARAILQELAEPDGDEHFDALLEPADGSPDGYARLDGVADVLANPRTGTLVLTGQPTAFHDCDDRGCGSVGHKIGEFDVDASLFMQGDHGEEDARGE